MSSNTIRRIASRYRWTKIFLRLTGVEFIGGETKGWGFWLKDRVNPRTGSTWHSLAEALEVARAVRRLARLIGRSSLDVHHESS